MTKSKFKEYIKNKSNDELKSELEKTNKEIMTANNLRSEGQNPYHKGYFPLKILKWKRKLLKQKIE